MVSVGKTEAEKGSTGAYEKIAITLPSRLAKAARGEVTAHGAPSLSAFIAQAVEEKLERDGLRELLDDIFATEPMTDKERAWADRLLLGH